MIWHNASADEVVNHFKSDRHSGLNNGEAHLRLQKYGKNYISKDEKPRLMKLFLNQLRSKTVIALIIIALISFFVSLAYSEVNSFSSLLIIAIVLINTFISAYQLNNCNKTLEDIKHIINPTVNVVREGNIKQVNAELLVPGDIILLEEGDYIPADARIIECNEFRCNESVLTEVLVPVEKNADITFDEITVLQKRDNMVFCGCNVIHGTATACVVATGNNTEIGRNSTILQQTVGEEHPFTSQLVGIGRITNTIILLICVIVFIISMILNFSSGNFASMTVKMLVNSVALAVAAIPEGLPAIATIVTAIGINRILKDKIIVKDTTATELLGKTDVICCDKTGVFTRNKMQLHKIFDGKKLTDLTEDQLDESTSLVLRIATACSTLTNDSTEDAIEKACLEHCSMNRTDLEAFFPHIAVIPFDSVRKTMTVITMINEKPFAIVKGAPENVLPNCVDCDGEGILRLNDDLANDAYRNVCIAMRPLGALPANPTAEEIERNLTFVGLLALNDPPREGIIEDIAACDEAGIKTVMITGDNLTTAKAVARRIGILKDGTLAITGAELQNMSDEELAENIESYSVFARVSPEDKLRIVNAWQSRAKIITITGDNLEDADALAQADVGCAIGRYGADVAKGNADIIISNNRFDSILRAVKESRGLFNNIKKSVYYLFSCNFAEILCMVAGLLIFRSFPITAVTLLWINLLTDSAPAISLSMESADESVMKSRPVTKLIDGVSLVAVALQSIFIAAITLISYAIGLDFTDTAIASTMAFATLSLTQIFHCYNNKFKGTILRKELFGNRFLNVSSAVILFFVVFLVFTPSGFLFGLTILSLKEFLICLLLAFLIIPFTEILKLIAKLLRNNL